MVNTLANCIVSQPQGFTLLASHQGRSIPPLVFPYGVDISGRYNSTPSDKVCLLLALKAATSSLAALIST